MREENQVRQAIKIIESYSFNQPLSRFFSEFFRANKQMGSKDRKLASQLVYGYFRLGKYLKELSIEERIAIANFLVSKEGNTITKLFSDKFGLSKSSEASLADKLNFIKSKYEVVDFELFFPFSDHLSEGIDHNEFIYSHLKQPRLYIRVRNKFKAQVIAELKKTEIPYLEEGPVTLSFANGTALQNLESFRKGLFEIQDKSSQLTGSFFKPQENEHWWDCCAASGGKSLLLTDQLPNIKLFVTDLRPSVISNLNERFQKAGLKNFKSRALDLTSNFKLNEGPFDGIIVDAPCSGSGTWSRTPEMISAFDEKEIKTFQSLQKNIASAVVQYLKHGKPLIYITCSVFKEENEDVVSFLEKETTLKLEEYKIIKGYENEADSMFVARFVKE